MMSEETQQRVLEEDLESEEGDLESYLEEESSSELLERVRELQVSYTSAWQRHRENNPENIFHICSVSPC